MPNIPNPPPLKKQTKKQTNKTKQLFLGGLNRTNLNVIPVWANTLSFSSSSRFLSPAYSQKFILNCRIRTRMKLTIDSDMNVQTFDVLCMFYSWMYPAYRGISIGVVAIWRHLPQITIMTECRATLPMHGMAGMRRPGAALLLCVWILNMRDRGRWGWTQEIRVLLDFAGMRTM